MVVTDNMAVIDNMATSEISLLYVTIALFYLHLCSLKAKDVLK